MEYQNIKIEVENGIGILTLNRPDVRNALDYRTWDEIREGMRELKYNDKVRVIILTGAGGKAFASGADIRALQVRTVGEQMNSEINDILYEIQYLTKPVIAAVDGYALGGGCELSMACDIRIATKKSKFGQPEANLAIIPACGGTQRLQRLEKCGVVDGFLAPHHGVVVIQNKTRIFQHGVLLPHGALGWLCHHTREFPGAQGKFWEGETSSCQIPVCVLK